MPDGARNRCGRTSNGGYVRYSPVLPQKLFDYLSTGKTVFDLCYDLGCSRSTFYKWVKKYPEFERIFREGREAGKEIWLGRCMEPEGKLPNTSFHRLLTTNIYGPGFIAQLKKAKNKHKIWHTLE